MPLAELSKVIYARACSNSRYIRHIFWDRYLLLPGLEKQIDRLFDDNNIMLQFPSERSAFKASIRYSMIKKADMFLSNSLNTWALFCFLPELSFCIRRKTKQQMSRRNKNDNAGYICIQWNKPQRKPANLGVTANIESHWKPSKNQRLHSYFGEDRNSWKKKAMEIPQSLRTLASERAEDKRWRGSCQRLIVNWKGPVNGKRPSIGDTEPFIRHGKLYAVIL